VELLSESSRRTKHSKTVGVLQFDKNGVMCKAQDRFAGLGRLFRVFFFVLRICFGFRVSDFELFGKAIEENTNG